jgi:chemotaxis protein MotB
MKLKDNIRMDMIAEGLRIQIVDNQNRPMFDSGGDEVKGYMRELLRGIGTLLNQVQNRISLTGHTDATPFSNGLRGRSNWELSTERANASRRELIAGGMKGEKVLRIVGMASAVPMHESDPFHPSNRRISIVVLTEDAARILLSEPEKTDPDEFADQLDGDAERTTEGQAAGASDQTASEESSPEISDQTAENDPGQAQGDGTGVAQEATDGQ